MNDTERLTQIRARVAAATPGPWERREDWSAKVERVYPSGSLLDSIGMAEQSAVFWLQGSNSPNFRADGDFIAHAREDVPWLLGQLAAAEAERETICTQVRNQTQQIASLTGALDDCLRWIDAAVASPMTPSGWMRPSRMDAYYALLARAGQDGQEDGDGR